MSIIIYLYIIVLHLIVKVTMWALFGFWHRSLIYIQFVNMNHDIEIFRKNKTRTSECELANLRIVINLTCPANR